MNRLDITFLSVFFSVLGSLDTIISSARALVIPQEGFAACHAALRDSCVPPGAAVS
jgi:hypothetical protein